MMRTPMAWHPSRGGKLRGFPSYQRYRSKERIPSRTTLQVLLLSPPQWSKRKQAKMSNMPHPRHRQRSLLLLPPLPPPSTLLPSLLQLCI